MAAVTAASTVRTTWGDLTVHLFKISAVATADTFASGIPNIVFHMAGVNDTTTTQASQGVGATVSGSTFTLYPGEDTTELLLIVFSKS